MIGLTTYTTKYHIARATLEATCFQTRAILEAMAEDTKDQHSSRGDGDGPAGLEVLKVDGGMTASDTCMQIQADVLGVPVERPVFVFPFVRRPFVLSLTLRSRQDGGIYCPWGRHTCRGRAKALRVGPRKTGDARKRQHGRRARLQPRAARRRTRMEVRWVEQSGRPIKGLEK